MTDEPDTETDDDGGSDERRRERRAKWRKAIRNSFLDHVPEASQQSARSGAEIDADIAALEQRVSALETNDAKQDQRLTALEAGGGTDPVDPPIEPPIEPPAGKRYPTGFSDPMVGVPAGTQLTNRGSFSSTKDGETFQNLNVSGTITITHKNCKLINSRVTSSGYNLVKARVAGFEMHHCDIVATGNTGSNGFDGVGFIHHCKFSGAENCINVAGNGGVIEWNVMGQMGGVQGQAHYDCVQADGSIDGLIIRNNYIDNNKGDTSATMIDNYWGPIRNVTIENNFLGGGGMPAYLDGSFKGASNATNIVYRDNDMRRGGWDYFYWKSPGSGCVKTGNKDYLTGAPVG